MVAEDGTSYYVYPDGRVTKEDGTSVCKEGGYDCLEAYLAPKF